MSVLALSGECSPLIQTLDLLLPEEEGVVDKFINRQFLLVTSLYRLDAKNFEGLTEAMELGNPFQILIADMVSSNAFLWMKLDRVKVVLSADVCLLADPSWWLLDFDLPYLSDCLRLAFSISTRMTKS